MPTKLRKLKEQAIDSSKWRGHFMKPFVTYENKYYFSYCRYCDAYVQVTPKPLPNEIDIGGTAVALNCIGVKRGSV